MRQVSRECLHGCKNKPCSLRRDYASCLRGIYSYWAFSVQCRNTRRVSWGYCADESSWKCLCSLHWGSRLPALWEKGQLHRKYNDVCKSLQKTHYLLGSPTEWKMWRRSLWCLGNTILCPFSGVEISPELRAPARALQRHCLRMHSSWAPSVGSLSFFF